MRSFNRKTKSCNPEFRSGFEYRNKRSVDKVARQLEGLGFDGLASSVAFGGPKIGNKVG
jgi:hypothetical protein